MAVKNGDERRVGEREGKEVETSSSLDELVLLLLSSRSVFFSYNHIRRASGYIWDCSYISSSSLDGRMHVQRARSPPLSPPPSSFPLYLSEKLEEP